MENIASLGKHKIFMRVKNLRINIRETGNIPASMFYFIFYLCGTLLYKNLSVLCRLLGPHIEDMMGL